MAEIEAALGKIVFDLGNSLDFVLESSLDLGNFLDFVLGNSLEIDTTQGLVLVQSKRWRRPCS